MPVRKKPNGRWTIGGKTEFDTKAAAERAYGGYMWRKKHEGSSKSGGKRRGS